MIKITQEPKDNCLIDCKCGCGQKLIKYVQRRNIGKYVERQYIHGHNSKTNKIKALCETCHKPISVALYKIKMTKHFFCSKVCAGEFKRCKVSIECPNCHVKFDIVPARYKKYKDKKVFCSKKCQIDYNTIIRNCHYCGKEIKRTIATNKERVYCSQKCQHNWLSENFRGKIHPNWTGTRKQIRGGNWAEMRRKAKIRDGFKCKLCGGTNRISVHHIIPVRLFDNPEDSNVLNNLITLCTPCHSKAEPKKNKLNPLNEKLKILL